jgi:AraC family transcriptional regulator
MPLLEIDTAPFKGFSNSTAPLFGTMRGAAMAFTRVGLGRDHDGLHLAFDNQDAFYVIFQLRSHAAHPYWENGRARPAPESPRGSLHIADLGTQPSAVLTGRFDSLNMIIPRGYLDALTEDAGATRVESMRVPACWTTQDPVLAVMAPVLTGALGDPQAGSSFFVDHLAAATALHLAQHYGGMRRPVIRPGGLAPWQEKRAREMIAGNLGKEIPLADVAAACGLSVSHFAKAFRASTGMTPHGWLQSCRLDHARALLRRPELAFAEIALRCGFADQSHFTRIFRRATGTTPGAWRRLNLF